jgi:CubicO group peptidase (beta-lactamase class C family)
MKELTFCLLLLTGSLLFGQSSYFPPTTNANWATLSLEDAGFSSTNEQALYDYLADTDTDAFLLLKDGKIVIEKYFGDFTAFSPHVWNSAGKSLMAVAVGIAIDLDSLDINDPTADYLGTGWTSCPETEDSIKVIHQLSMTSGLFATPSNFFCTSPECLECLTDPGGRWSYHNGPYTLLGEVVESATGQDLNDFIAERIKQHTGMTGQYRYFGDNRIFLSNARSMARFGLLMINGGHWDGTAVLQDTSYFEAMTNSSQDFNKSYGYLWWLNGKASYRLPDLETEFEGPLLPSAPAETFAAVGKDGQLINIAPNQGLVMVRMGSTPGNSSLVVANYNDSIWTKINDLTCTTSIASVDPNERMRVFPNPATTEVRLSATTGLRWVTIYDGAGRSLARLRLSGSLADINLEAFPKGLLHLRIVTQSGDVLWRKVVRR